MTKKQPMLPLDLPTARKTTADAEHWSLSPALSGTALACGADRIAKEEWRRSKTWPHLWASSLGRIATTGRKRPRPARVLPIHRRRRDDYYLIGGNAAAPRNAAHIICDAWHGPRPFRGAQVDHIDGNRMNDLPGNLQWLSPAENVQKGRRAKLTTHAVAKILDARREGASVKSIAAAFNVRPSTIESVLYQKRWTNVPRHRRP